MKLSSLLLSVLLFSCGGEAPKEPPCTPPSQNGPCSDFELKQFCDGLCMCVPNSSGLPKTWQNNGKCQPH